MVTAFADAAAQLESLVSRPEPAAVERRRTTALLKLDRWLAPPEASQLADGQDAQEPESLLAAQPTLVAGQLVGPEPKMSASRASPERSSSAAEQQLEGAALGPSQQGLKVKQQQQDEQEEVVRLLEPVAYG